MKYLENVRIENLMS